MCHRKPHRFSSKVNARYERTKRIFSSSPPHFYGEIRLLWKIRQKRWTNANRFAIIFQRLWRDVRAVECARLESGYTERYRRFKSCSLRQSKPKSNTKVFGLGFIFAKNQVLSAFFSCRCAVILRLSVFVLVCSYRFVCSSCRRFYAAKGS